MTYGGVGTDAARLRAASPGTHPSAPIPVQGLPVGDGVRVALGESGLRIFPLILGGAEFGWHIDPAASHAVLDAYRERGGNAVHTSDDYASGRSEHIIGQWLRTRGIRDDIVLAVRAGGGAEHRGLGAVNLVRAVEASLRSLQTDRIDLLYLDATADPTARIEDTLATADWLVETGKVRALGAFGHTAGQLVEARILASAGYPRFTVLDVAYNPLRRRDFDDDLRLVAGAQGIPVTASRALEHGYLSGAHRSRAAIAKSVRGLQIAASMNRRGARALKVLDRIGAELSLPPAAVAIAWSLAQRGVAAPIVNTREVRHVDEIVQGVGAQLSRGQLAEISRATA